MGDKSSSPMSHSHRCDFHYYHALGICGSLFPRPCPKMMRKQSWLMVGLLIALLGLFLSKFRITHNPFDYWRCAHNVWLLPNVVVNWGCRPIDNLEKSKQTTMLQFTIARGDDYENSCVDSRPEFSFSNITTGQRLETIEAYRMSPSEPWRRCTPAYYFPVAEDEYRLACSHDLELIVFNVSTGQHLESVEAFRMSPSDPWQRCEL